MQDHETNSGSECPEHSCTEQLGVVKVFELGRDTVNLMLKSQF